MEGKEALPLALHADDDPAFGIGFIERFIPLAHRHLDQIIPGKSWFTIFRLYGPLQPWFAKSWKLPDIQKVS